MTNVPHILAIPEWQVSASARRVLAAHLGPRAAQRQDPSAIIHRDEPELESFASGHLQNGFAVTLLDFHRHALKPCEMCFCCCFAAVSALKQLLATICMGATVLHRVCWEMLWQRALWVGALADSQGPEAHLHQSALRFFCDPLRNPGPAAVREVAELQVRCWGMLHKRGIPFFAEFTLCTCQSQGEPCLFHTRVFWAPTMPPQHRALPVSAVGGTAAENYAAEGMSSCFWQQGIICLFSIRRRNSSPAQAGLPLTREPWIPRLQCGQMAVTGAGHGERGPQSPMVTCVLYGLI